MNRRGQRGATLVEAAIIIPLLLLILFAVIDFGWTFYQYISVRQGVREAAREAAITTLPQPGSGTWAGLGCTLAAGNNVPTPLTSAPGVDFYDMICYAKSRIGLGMGSGVRVSITWSSKEAQGWAPTTVTASTDSLVVCAQYQVSSLTGAFTPILNGKVVTSKTEIRIEQQSTDVNAAYVPPTATQTVIAEPALSTWPASCTSP